MGDQTNTGFLGDLSSVLTGYLSGRANLLLSQEAGGNYIPNNLNTQGQPAQTATSSLFSSPLLWLGLAAVGILIVLIVARKK